MINELDVDLKS